MNISIKFNQLDSSQLLNDINGVNAKPLGHCHIADLFRLSKKIELCEEYDAIIERTSSKYDSHPKLLRIRDIICTLKVLLNENQSEILNTLETFSNIARETKGNDEIKALDSIISGLQQSSKSLHLIKLMTNQSVIYYPYVLIKSKLEKLYPLIDKNGYWNIDVKVFRDVVKIEHIKSMKSKEVCDVVELVWNFSITYNFLEDIIEKCDLEISSIIFSEDVDDNKKDQIVESIKNAIE